jgi:hypothetical protein
MATVLLILAILLIMAAIACGLIAQANLTDPSKHARVVLEGVTAPNSRFTPRGIRFRRASYVLLLLAFLIAAVWVFL